MIDYFTRAEFLHYAGDPRGERYTPENVDRAQAEVIDLLEEWARSSWANVAAAIAATGSMGAGSAVLTVSAGAFIAGDVGKPIAVEGAGAGGGDLVTTIASYTSVTQVTLAAAAVTAVTTATVRLAAGTDGVAPAYRSRTDEADGGHLKVLASRIPVVSVYSFKVGDTAIPAANYHLDLEAGLFRFALESLAGIRNVDFSYRYGHGAAPWAIKRPAMQAARSRLDGEEGRGRIPPNVSRYTTEGAVFEFGTPGGDEAPWSWDLDASRDVRSYWGARRPSASGIRV